MSPATLLPLRECHVVGVMLLAMSLAGCQNNRAALIPPPGGLPQGDPYYTRPVGASAGQPASTSPVAGAPVNLAPGGLLKLPAPPITSGSANGASRVPRDTYDVATRVAADGQPIRVLDSTTNPPGSLASRGMTLNDGTTARGWQTGAGLPASVAANPFHQLRGGSSSPGSLPQGFSGQDGQWRSRSSYEGTERR